MTDLKKYIGKQYEKYNCFDLVKEYYIDHFDLDLRNYYEGQGVPPRRTVQSLVISNKGDFVRVTEPQSGDIVVINLFGMECHIGIYIHPKKILHSMRVVGSSLEGLERYKRMIAGYYRHRNWA